MNFPSFPTVSSSDGRRSLQRPVVGGGEPPIVPNVLRLAVFQVARHNSQQISNLLLAAPMGDEPAVLGPIGKTHAARIFPDLGKSRESERPAISQKPRHYKEPTLRPSDSG